MENPMVLRPNEFSIPVTMEVDVVPSAEDQVDSIVAGFEDDLAGGRSSPRAGADIRSHLDDLARRHPDLADQLRGFPGGGVDPAHQTTSTDTAPRDRTFSNSATEKTAPDGAKATPDTQNGAAQQNDSKIGNLQNHGLRNTVPLVDPSKSPAHPMSQDNGSRSPRAQSAPPQSAEEPQRFVSKIEIQPSHNQQETAEMFIPTGDENQAPASHPTGQQQAHNNFNNNQQQQQQHEPNKTPHAKQPNVRHIPIFVEGRDAPIVNRDHESSQPSASTYHEAPSYHHPPGYHEPNAPHQIYREPIFEPVFTNTPVDRPFGGAHHTSGGVGFDIPIHTERGGYRSPNLFGNSGFSKPSQARPPPQEKVHRVFNQHQTQADPTSHQQNTRNQQQQPHPSGPSPHDVPDGAAPTPGTTGPSPPPKKMSRPKTPLEIIQEVQGEVDKLKAEIDKFTGTTRSDKEYIYLDEMLTRELLKLDNVDSGGVEEIRNLRRQTIKNIQTAISALEAKVPSSPSGAVSEEVQDSTAVAGGEAPAEGQTETPAPPSEVPMEVDTKSEGEAKPEAGEGKEGGASQSEPSKAEGKDGSGDTAQPSAQGEQK